ncbi:hypothetical protein [Kordia sp.]|uniref:hypothetical protein n=1 Tax=Kordia sp. TaxID=1965332 RepID=UPI003D6B28FA
MNTHTFRLLLITIMIPFIAIGQQFLDVNDKNEGSVKPMIQKDKALYHYSKLTTLPFENDCSPELSEKELAKCAESHLRKMIFKNLDLSRDFKGSAYVYLTVTTEGKITNISATNFPRTYDLSDDFINSVQKLQVKPGTVEGKVVNTRLWTSFSFPSSSKELLSESLAKMRSDENPTYEKYEALLFDAAQYVFALPVFEKGRECNAAFNIVRFWMDVDTETAIPLGGKFYETLTNNQKFLYVIAVLKYQLEQKHYEGRMVFCNPKGDNVDKQKLRKEIKEVQLEAAKILLTYMSDEENNVRMKSKTKKFYKAMKKGKLKEKLFD